MMGDARGSTVNKPARALPDGASIYGTTAQSTHVPAKVEVRRVVRMKSRHIYSVLAEDRCLPATRAPHRPPPLFLGS